MRVVRNLKPGHHDLLLLPTSPGSARLRLRHSVHRHVTPEPTPLWPRLLCTCRAYRAVTGQPRAQSVGGNGLTAPDTWSHLGAPFTRLKSSSTSTFGQYSSSSSVSVFASMVSINSHHAAEKSAFSRGIKDLLACCRSPTARRCLQVPWISPVWNLNDGQEHRRASRSIK